MDTLVADAPIHDPRPRADDGDPAPVPASPRTASPLWLSGGVTALALLSFVVQVLDEPAQRAQLQYQAQLGAVALIDAPAPQPTPEPGPARLRTAATLPDRP